MDKLINNINKEEQDRVAAIPPPPAKKKKHYQSSHKLPFKSCSEPLLLKAPDIGHLQISGIYHSSKITKLQTEVDRNFSQARKSPSGINSSLSFLNMDLSPNIWNLLSIEDSIGKRILEGYQGEEPLTTQVRAFNILLTGSPYDMNYIFSNSAIADNWINSSRDYIELAFGAENILRFVLHVDQGSQHIHVIMVALNSQGQLPIKNIEEKFSAIMNGYYEHMFAFRSMPIHPSTKHVNLPGESYERSRLYLEYKAALENINPYERILKKSKDFLNDFNAKKDFDDSESSEDYFDLI